VILKATSIRIARSEVASYLRSSPPRPAAPEQLEFDFIASGKAATERDRSVEPLLTVAEACVLFNLKPHVLRRAIKAGSIPSYRIGNGRVRVRASDIERAIDASRQGGVN
jgi:excisionase family DNA binding protein